MLGGSLGDAVGTGLSGPFGWLKAAGLLMADSSGASEVGMADVD